MRAPAVLRGGHRSSLCMGALLIGLTGLLVYLILAPDLEVWHRLLIGSVGVGIPLSAVLALSVFAEHAAGLRAGQLDLRDQVLAEVRRLLPTLVEIRDVSRETSTGQALLRNGVAARDQRTEGWLSDIAKGVMRVGEKATEGVAAAHRERAAMMHSIGQLGDDVREAVADVLGPVLERVAETVAGMVAVEREARGAAVEDVAQEMRQAIVQTKTELREEVSAVLIHGFHQPPGNVASLSQRRPPS